MDMEGRFGAWEETEEYGITSLFKCWARETQQILVTQTVAQKLTVNLILSSREKMRMPATRRYKLNHQIAGD